MKKYNLKLIINLSSLKYLEICLCFVTVDCVSVGAAPQLALLLVSRRTRRMRKVVALSYWQV